MVKISYHTLGAAIFCLGLLLQIKWPGQDETIGHQLFEAYSLPVAGSLGVSYVWITGVIIQVIGVLVFMKWLSVEHPQFFKKYTRFEPICLAVLLFAVPIGFNSLLSTSAKTYVYAAENGADAIEFLDGECTMTEENKEEVYDCIITLKNYEHQSQQVILYFPISESLRNEKQVTAYLQVHEEKEIKVQFTADEIVDMKRIPEFTIQS